MFHNHIAQLAILLFQLIGVVFYIVEGVLVLFSSKFVWKMEKCMSGQGGGGFYPRERGEVETRNEL